MACGVNEHTVFGDDDLIRVLSITRIAKIKVNDGCYVPEMMQFVYRIGVMGGIINCPGKGKVG